MKINAVCIDWRFQFSAEENLGIFSEVIRNFRLGNQELKEAIRNGWIH
ncbi:hypothetical protein LEP1GSC058_2857 [Leptospira fainei serovar Hurstbridge str. BUT 6]|uniref:Uncharacterized protein n=1 Tax=Leptospira fainei serovar Hurstbridge str. BUT 6 TaxID=1193011 RepID=S3W060_9LEPT|nr:hypothetical protein LEP1GSC058_2857 [Leptospira fainei serovar Hurstbridge str. BUT 6]